MYCCFKIFCFFQSVSSFTERFRYDRIQCCIRAGDGISGANHTEFKLITCKGKWRSTVTVCCIFIQIRQCGYTCLQLTTLFAGSSITCFYKLFYYVLKLFTEEHGNDCRRCFVCPKSMVVSDIGCGLAEQICMFVNRFHDAGKYKQELDIFIWCITRLK